MGLSHRATSPMPIGSMRRVDDSTRENLTISGIVPLPITAMGHQRRQMCLPDGFGFPRTTDKEPIPTGTKLGTSVWRVVVRETGHFTLTTSTVTIQRLHVKCFTPVPMAMPISKRDPLKNRTISTTYLMI